MQPMPLPSLTGLRFIAALAVFVCHTAMYWHQTGAPQLVLKLTAGGSLGVSLFFILSGFVLTHSARQGDRAAAFWRRRAAKILPNHVVGWALMMAILLVGVPRLHPVPGITAADDLAGALLFPYLLPTPKNLAAGNPVAWSLVCEALFYLLFPLLLPLVNRIPSGRLRLAGLLVAALAWIPAVFAWKYGAPPTLDTFQMSDVLQPGLAYVYFFPLSRLPEFVLGMLLARHHRHPSPIPVGTPTAALLVLAATGAGALLLPLPFLFAAAPLVPLALLIQAAAAADSQQRPSLLRAPVMTTLGTWSYAFYLLHCTVLAAAFHYAGTVSTALPLACLSLALALCGAAVLYRWVELPCTQRLASPPLQISVGSSPNE